MTVEEFAEFLEDNGRPLAGKHLRFRKDTIRFEGDYSRADGRDGNEYQILGFRKRPNGGNRLWISEKEAVEYLEHLKSMSVELTYEDVQTVVKEYQSVLRRPRKKGMRGDRNFTGKVEDEIRGKLAEEGLSKFCKKVYGISFPPHYEPLEPGQMRDQGDFDHMLVEMDGVEKDIPLPENMKIAVKSTAGYFSFAVPENEWNWPGSIYIAVRPHLNQNFLLRLMNKALDLEDFELNATVGWLEVDGYITKQEMERQAYVGKRLPGAYHGRIRDWDLRNYIMHPLQIHRTLDEFKSLLNRYLQFAKTA